MFATEQHISYSRPPEASLRKILYTLPSGPTENAYREGERLVLLRRAALPDACVSSGNPARGNVFHKEFKSWPWLWVVLPIGLDVVALLLGKNYVFDFPFCPNCSPADFRLTEIRIEGDIAVLKGASDAFLSVLLPATSNVVTELNRDWLQRKFRWFYS